MELHKVLMRQIRHAKLNPSECPNLDGWRKFLERVNRFYNDADQERRLSEHSQELSGSEMNELYAELQEAQHLAHIGSWSWSKETDSIHLSAEAAAIINFDTSNCTYGDFINLIYSDDFSRFNEERKKALTDKVSFEISVRIKMNDRLTWVQLNGKPIYDNENQLIRMHGTIMDINSKKLAQERELHRQLLNVARQMGMADVATSVLHNVGNILNSVNVSVTLLQEKLKQSKILKGFDQVNKILNSHTDDFAHYITQDPQGKQLPVYLLLLEKTLKENQVSVMEELDSLAKNIQHIKDVIIMQQNLSKPMGGLIEATVIADEIQNVINIVGFDNSYNINRNLKILEKINLDKAKLTQILVNLTNNAKDSLITSRKQEKNLTFVVDKDQPDFFYIKVIDNGIGIIPNNLIKVFSFGFTTKPTGHGFGLHNSALLAAEMGGKLNVESPGENQGAIFTLELPYRVTGK